MAEYDAAVSKMFEERLHNFYKAYDASKLDSIPGLLTKYKGKEEMLLRAMVKKYGPEPEQDEDAEEDEDDDETASGEKEEAVQADDALEEEQEHAGDEQPDEELVYCEVCGLPPEYCEYSRDYEKCVPWLKENYPQHLKSAEDEESAKKSKGKRGGGVIKKKEFSEDKQVVVVYTETRSRKKTVTVVEGLETVSVNMKDASKLFGRKFACSSSVKDKDTGGKEIVIQGDVIYDLPDLLVSEFKVSRSKIYTKEAGKLVKLR